MNESKNQNTSDSKEAAIVKILFFIRLFIDIVNSASDKTTYPVIQSLNDMNHHRPPQLLEKHAGIQTDSIKQTQDSIFAFYRKTGFGTK